MVGWLCCFFEPDVDFVKSDKKENLLLKFIPVFLPHKKFLFYALLRSYYSKSTSQNAEVQSYLYESLNGVATVKALNAEEIVNMVPLDKILIETDSPYLSPEPLRGKRNDSRNVKYIAQRIAEAKGISLEKVAKTTYANAKKIFNL